MTRDYYNTKASVEEYIEMAKDVNGSELIEKLKEVLPKDSELLELGSGPGSDWEILCKNYKVTGSDNSSEFLNHLKKRHPSGNFLFLDAISIETTSRFDGIYSNKVLQHLNDVELADSIKRQNTVLNPNGIVCHSFWKGSGTEIFKGLFVNYHEKESLSDFFNDYFEILSMDYYQEFDEEDSILLIGRKK